MSGIIFIDSILLRMTSFFQQLGRLLGYETVAVLKIREILDKSGKVLLPSAPEDAFMEVAVLRLD
jgi:hypothetical protein